MLCPTGVLDTKQPHAKHHYPSDRADRGGAGWRVQALPASAYPTHVTCLHARQQHRAQCYHQGECNAVQFRWQNHQSCCAIIGLYLAKVLYLIIFHDLKTAEIIVDNTTNSKLLLFSNVENGLLSCKIYLFLFFFAFTS